MFMYLRSCDHIVIANLVLVYIYTFEVVITVIHLSLHVLFLFLFIHMFLIYCMQSLYFCFTLRCLDEFFFKCFRNTGCQSLSCHELSSCQSFSRVCVRMDFIVFNKWVWVEWFMASLICSFVCCDFITDFQRGRLLEYMWFNVRNICQHFI